MIKTMKALVKREFWEHRGAFIKTPIIIGIVLLVLEIIGYIISLVFASKTSSQEIMDRGINELSNLSQSQLSTFWDIQFVAISSLYLLVLFIVLFFYLLGSLFDDRKDGSIQFWKSLPISDAETVLSKLLTALVFVPIVTTVLFTLMMVANMLLTSIILLFHGQNPWSLVWQPASLFKGAYTMFLGTIVQMVWALPVYGWLMFCSAWTKRRPFLFAMFIPLIVAVSWYVLNVITRLNFFQVEMFKAPMKHLLFGLVPYGANAKKNNFGLQIDDDTSITEVLTNLTQSLGHIEILYGIIFAAIFISLSIWVRRYRNTT